MFFKDENKIDVIQLGTGDVMVSELELANTKNGKCVGIAFAPTKTGEINRSLPEFDEKKDFECGVKLKILFTRIESIDVVINELKQAKVLMQNDLTKQSTRSKQ